MKKLMIAAAIVCAAAFAQASTVTWGYEGDIKNATGTGLVADGQAYVFYLGETGSFTVFDDGTYELSGGASLVTFKDPYDTPVPIVGGALNDLDMPMSRTTENGKYALVMMYQNAADNNAFYYNYLEQSATGLDVDPTKTADITFAGSSINLSIKGESVPEPTSGLLLLLGVAGLALRRRRA